MKKYLLIFITLFVLLPMAAFAQTCPTGQRADSSGVCHQVLVVTPDSQSGNTSSNGNCVNGRTDTGTACFTGPAISNGPVTCGTSGADPATCVPAGTNATGGNVSCSSAGADPATCIPTGSAAATPSTIPNTASTNTSGCPNGGTITNGVCNLGYTPLEPIPGITPGANGVYDLTSPGGFSKFINAIFTILITGGALLAVLMLTIGGVQYMTASSVGNKTQGLDRARAAIYGILLIAATWLILNTINPHLLNFDFIVCQGGGNSTVCTSAATVNNTTNSTSATTPTNSDVGYTGNVNDLTNSINNDTPNPAECAAAQVGAGVKSADDPGIIANLGSSLQRGANQAYYVAKAAFWDNGINNTPSQIWSLGSAAVNQIQTAESGFIAKCQAAGY